MKTTFRKFIEASGNTPEVLKQRQNDTSDNTFLRIRTFNNPSDICEAFEDLFSSVFNYAQTMPQTSTMHDHENEYLPIPLLSNDDILAEIQAVKEICWSRQNSFFYTQEVRRYLDSDFNFDF